MILSIGKLKDYIYSSVSSDREVQSFCSTFMFEALRKLLGKPKLNLRDVPKTVP